MAQLTLAETREVSPVTGATTGQAGADAVQAISFEYAEMEKHWRLPLDLMQGSKRMQEEREVYLPKETAEDSASYFRRLTHTFLYGAFRDTVDKVVSKPFSRPISIEGMESLDPRLQELAKNSDRVGSNISQFASEVMRWSVVYGHTFVLVNFPRTMTSDESTPLSVQEEREKDIRPFFVHIRPSDLIGWRYTIANNGVYELTDIRWRTHEMVNVGVFGQKRVETIHHLTPETFTKWQFSEDTAEFEVVDEGVNTLGMVPLHAYYTNHTGFFTSRPPLESLAELNLAHYQSLSDQRNLLHIARVPIIFMKGFTSGELDEGIVVGAGSVTGTTNESASLEFVEHTGRALGAGRQDLEDLEERMTVLGLQPLIERSGVETATGRVMDEAKTHANIQEWVRGLEEFLITLFQTAADWIKVDLPNEFNVHVFSDFTLSARSQVEVDALIKTRADGEIDGETFINELRRRGFLAESITYEEIRRRLDSEAPTLDDQLKSLQLVQAQNPQPDPESAPPEENMEA